MHFPFESKSVVLESIFRHKRHPVRPHGLQPLVSSKFAFSLNSVLTSLSRRLLGHLYAIKGGSANILDNHCFYFKNPQCLWAISAMYVVCRLYVVTNGVRFRSSLFSLISRHCSWLFRSTLRICSNTSPLL